MADEWSMTEAEVMAHTTGSDGTTHIHLQPIEPAGTIWQVSRRILGSLILRATPELADELPPGTRFTINLVRRGA